MSEAKKSRNRDKTRGRIDKQLQTMKAKNFVDYDLEPLVIKAEGKEINSFRIVPKETDDNKKAIKNAERTDGLWTLVTNTLSKEDDKNRFAEEDLIRAYRDKNQIEQSFKDVKSFIKIQPFQCLDSKTRQSTLYNMHTLLSAGYHDRKPSEGGGYRSEKYTKSV